jgi:hypothetical protein
MDNFFKQGVNAEIQFEQSHASLEGSNLKDKIQANRLQNQSQPTSTSMAMKYQK